MFPGSVRHSGPLSFSACTWLWEGPFLFERCSNASVLRGARAMSTRDAPRCAGAHRGAGATTPPAPQHHLRPQHCLEHGLQVCRRVGNAPKTSRSVSRGKQQFSQEGGTRDAIRGPLREHRRRAAEVPARRRQLRSQARKEAELCPRRTAAPAGACERASVASGCDTRLATHRARMACSITCGIKAESAANTSTDADA